MLSLIEEEKDDIVITKKRSRIGGMVHGSLSVVHQLHKLVMRKLFEGCW